MCPEEPASRHTQSPPSVEEINSGSRGKPGPTLRQTCTGFEKKHWFPADAFAVAQSFPCLWTNDIYWPVLL